MKTSKIPLRESYLEDMRSSGLSEEAKRAVFRAEEYSLKYPLSLEEARELQVRRKAELERLQKENS